MDVPGEDDVLVILGRWHDSLHPWRGGVAVPDGAVDRSAAERWWAWAGENEHLVPMGIEPDLAERAHAHRGGEADPLGAAAIAAVLGSHPAAGRREDWADGLADAWVAEYGLGFAARAFVELTGLAPDIDLMVRPADATDYRDVAGRTGRSGFRRMRALLAAAAEADFLAVADDLAAMRTAVWRQVVVSYLVPTRAGWMDECLAGWRGTPLENSLRWMVWCTLTSAEQLGRFPFDGKEDVDRGGLPFDAAVTLLGRAGVAASPVLEAALTRRLRTEREHRPFVDLVVPLLTDEVLGLVVDGSGRADGPFAALAETMRRDPAMALRVLAEWAGRGTAEAEESLRAHLRVNPGLAVGDLPGPSGEAVRAQLRVLERDMPARDLPAVLVDPPWTRTAAEPIVIEGLSPSADRAAVWAPGERENWASQDPAGSWGRTERQSWEDDFATYRRGELEPWFEAGLFSHGPMALAHPLIENWTPPDPSGAEIWMKRVAARHGLPAVRPVLAVTKARPEALGGLLVPFRDAEVAEVMLGWLGERDPLREFARAWLERHGTGAARWLIPEPACDQQGQDGIDSMFRPGTWSMVRPPKGDSGTRPSWMGRSIGVSGAGDVFGSGGLGGFTGLRCRSFRPRGRSIGRSASSGKRSLRRLPLHRLIHRCCSSRRPGRRRAQNNDSRGPYSNLPDPAW